MLGVLQLIRQRDDAAAAAERDAEEPRQCRQHDDGLLRAAVFGHPHDAIEGIIQEVGVDLALQDVELAAALFLLLLQDVVHQMAHGGDHRLDGTAQVGDLVGAAYIKVHRFPPLFQLPHGAVQLFHRGGDPFRKAEIDKDQKEDGEEHHEHGEPQKLAEIIPQRFLRDDADQLPAGVAHRFDGDLTALRMEGLGVGAVGVACGGEVIFLLQAGIDELLPGVVDDLAVAIDEVEVALPVGKPHILADLLDAAEVHIHQKQAALRAAAPGQFDLTADGDHPMVAVIGIDKEILDMGGGKMQVLDALHGAGEPVLPVGGDAVFEILQRGGGHQ